MYEDVKQCNFCLITTTGLGLEFPIMSRRKLKNNGLNLITASLNIMLHYKISIQLKEFNANTRTYCNYYLDALELQKGTEIPSCRVDVLSRVTSLITATISDKDYEIKTQTRRKDKQRDRHQEQGIHNFKSLCKSSIEI